MGSGLGMSGSGVSSLGLGGSSLGSLGGLGGSSLGGGSLGGYGDYERSFDSRGGGADDYRGGRTSDQIVVRNVSSSPSSYTLSLSTH